MKIFCIHCDSKKLNRPKDNKKVIYKYKCVVCTKEVCSICSKYHVYEHEIAGLLAK